MVNDAKIAIHHACALTESITQFHNINTDLNPYPDPNPNPKR